MDAIADLLRIALSLVVVASPALVSVLAIIVFYRYHPDRVKAGRAFSVKAHLAALMSIALMSGVVGYHYGLLQVCAAHPEPQYNCRLGAALFAAPASFSVAACLYLIAYVFFGHRKTLA